MNALQSLQYVDTIDQAIMDGINSLCDYEERFIIIILLTIRLVDY